MSEADALQSENPSGCVEAALRRAVPREGWRYQMVAAELMRRGSRGRTSGVRPLRKPLAPRLGSHVH